VLGLVEPDPPPFNFAAWEQTAHVLTELHARVFFQSERIVIDH